MSAESGKNVSRIIAILTCVGILAIAGCSSGASAGSAASSSGTHDASIAAGAKVKVGLIVDAPINDRGYNQSAVDGLTKAATDLGVQTRTLISNTAADQVPNLAALAQQGYDLVIATGEDYADAVNTVAPKFPHTDFLIIDAAQSELKNRPANVESALFAMEQAGYLVGYVAGAVQTGSVARTNSKGVVGSVGGIQLPTVDQYIAGFQAGAKAADPNIKLLNGYSQTFSDSGACKELALNQIAAGADVIFPVAGNCGLGVIDAAKEKGIWAAGVDADQSYLGPQIIASAIKRVDTAVYDAAKQVVDHDFKGGTDLTFNLANDGVGIGKISSDVPQSVVTALNGVIADIKSGKTTIPTTIAKAN